MAGTYTLVICLESYEFDGEFYLLGEGYETPGDVLEFVAAEHILALDWSRPLPDYLVGVLRSGENVSRAVYEEADPDVECGIHADIYYGRVWLWSGETEVELPPGPTRGDIERVADRFRS